MKRRILLAIACTAAVFAAAGSENSVSAQLKKPSPKLAKQAKITMEQARDIALKRVGGTVEEGELEKEHGVLVYSFDIRNAKGTITEVQVDARSGQITRVEEEDAAAEAKEKRKEKNHN